MSDKKQSVAPPKHILYHQYRPENKWDLGKAFKEANPQMCNTYGDDKWSYKVENDKYWINHWHKNESKIAHGYPATYFLQAAIFYGCAFYTAHEQGMIFHQFS